MDKWHERQLYPYLAENGLYGYVDEQLDLVVPARYRSASPFTSTGFAIVSDENNRYGVINSAGALVVPLEYKTVYVEVLGKHTLLWTVRTYNSPLRFWEWRFLPGFWGASDRRLFDTQVKRSHLCITVLESGQRIYSERVLSELAYGYYFNIKKVDDTHFIRDGILYEIGRKRCRALAKHVFGQSDDGLLLQKMGDYYRLISVKGKAVGKRRFRYQDHLTYEIEGRRHILNLVSTYDYLHRVAHLFQDSDGEQYFFPDLTKAFPKSIAAQVHKDLVADTLIQNSMLAASMPHTDRFIFRRFNRGSNTFEYWMLDTVGNWHANVPEDNRFSVVSQAGDILWPSIEDIIPLDAVASGWKPSRYASVDEDRQLYKVTIRRDKEERMGIWNVAERKWQWKPEHAYIRYLGNGYWTFKSIQDAKYGLYQLSTSQVLISPRYHDMNGNGMVAYYDEAGQYIRFYVDWKTQREYWYEQAN
ncbi:WG repeat-containing protein [Olivibacter sitiensis]|uniref:WG repeat-containing protein n=1 Tax=Olivibacter sitiensis TaxID=376470 RepID=UPI00146FB38F|nr:WG repeat-containing protein [Olivibacter sitiensis]